jgi:tetratricopeptide (TPR) repeat protein
MMKAGSILGAMVLGLLVGCVGEPSKGETEETAAEEAGTAESAVETSQAAPVDAVVVRIERARRAMDRGAFEAAENELEGLLTVAKDPDERAEVLFALSQAYEENGDHEAAIDSVETILLENANRGRYAVKEDAERRLRLLLTGNAEEQAPPLPTNRQTPPITSALAELYEADADGRVLVDMLIFGRPRNSQSAIFEVAEAKRSSLERDLSRSIKVGHSITSTDGWIGLPEAIGESDPEMPQADRSTLVFYYDLGDGRIPSRYDAYLPMPSEEIAQMLERGVGVVVAREREGAKPTIVIAAPRKSQLEIVEKAFSEMTSLPFDPVSIPLEKKLEASEIQGEVRAHRTKIHACYEETLKRNPKASGSIQLEFTISEDGSVTKVGLGEGTTLREEGLEKCVLAEVRTFKFPAVGKPTTVKYPIAMTP